MNKLKQFLGWLLISIPFWIVLVSFSLKFPFLKAFLLALEVFIVAICIAFLIALGVKLIS